MSSRPHPRRARRAPPPPPAATAIGGVTLPCLQLVKTATFYTRALGLAIKGRSSRHVTLDADGVRLVLVDAARTPGFSRGKSQTAFLELQVPDLARLAQSLQAAGARIFPAREGSQGRMLTTRDPEGNVLNLVQQGR